jgi:hypothetical protein
LHSLAVGLFPRGEWDQVHFVTLLVPPVTPPGGLKLRGEFVEDVMFPELAQVVGPFFLTFISFLSFSADSVTIQT